MNISIHCLNCGSQDIERDATASWSYKKQGWVLGDLLDTFYCVHCDSDVRVVEQKIGTIKDE